MRERLLVERVEKVTAASGAEQTVKAVAYCHLPAERVRLTGRMSDEAGERFPDYHAEYNVRQQVRIEEHWQVTDLSTGYRYEVTNITPNRTRGYKTLYCERLND